MSIKVFAEGFIQKQPALVQLGNTCKVEFDICWKRSTRNRETGNFEDVPEYITFLAWGEEAQKLSESLVPGREVSAIGIQETSHWVDNNQQKRNRKIYKLIHIETHRRSSPQGQGQQQRQDGYRPQQPSQQHQSQGGAAEGYEDSSYGDGGYAGEPNVPAQQQRSQAAPQRQPQRQVQAQQPPAQASRFKTVY